MIVPSSSPARASGTTAPSVKAQPRLALVSVPLIDKLLLVIGAPARRRVKMRQTVLVGPLPRRFALGARPAAPAARARRARRQRAVTAPAHLPGFGARAATGGEVRREQLHKLAVVIVGQVDLDSLPVVGQNVSLVGFDPRAVVGEVKIVKRRDDPDHHAPSPSSLASFALMI